MSQNQAMVKPEIQIEGGLLQLRTLDDAYRFAKYVIASGLAPASFKTPEAVLIACQHGAEVGLKPMQSLQRICVVNGRPSLWGEAVPGVVLNSGKMEAWKENVEGAGDAHKATCWAKRKDGMDKLAEFSVGDAKRAGLWGKAGPWTNYPDDMLRYKARARCFRPLFADVLCGLDVAEDVQDVPVTRPIIKQAEGAVVMDADPLLASAQNANMVGLEKPIRSDSEARTVPGETSSPREREAKPAKEDSDQTDLSFPEDAIPEN